MRIVFEHGPRPSFLVEHGAVPHRVEYSDDLGPPLHAHEIFSSWAEYSIHIVLKSIFPIIPFFYSPARSFLSIIASIRVAEKIIIIHYIINYLLIILSISRSLETIIIFLFFFLFLAAPWHDRSSELKVREILFQIRDSKFSRSRRGKYRKISKIVPIFKYRSRSTFNEIIDLRNGNIDNYSLAPAAC